MSSESIKLTIVRGTNIKQKNSDRPADLYVKVLVFEGQYVTKYQTKIVKKSHHPIWNEEIDIKTDRVHPIRIEVYGKKSFRKDDDIGMCSIEWWLDTGLMEDGKAIVEADLKSIDISPDASGKQGKLTLKLQIPNFVKKVGVIGPKKAEDLPSIIARTAKATIKPGAEEAAEKKEKEKEKHKKKEEIEDVYEFIKESQIMFNVWCEETGKGEVISTSAKTTFAEISKMAAAIGGLNVMKLDEYRLFGSPTAFRNRYCNDLPYDPKEKLGDVLVLKKFNPEEKPYLRSKGKGVYEVLINRDIFVNVEYWKSNGEHEDPVRKTIKTGEQLSEIVNAICAEHGDNPEQAHLYRVGLSSEPGTQRALVELDKTVTMDQVYMTEGDTLVVRLMPPFKTFQEKFGDIKDTNKTAYSLISHCYYNPIHRVWKKAEEECPLPDVAANLKVSSEDAWAINEAAKDHAHCGCDEILIELTDRIANTAGSEYYKSSSFEDRDMYKKWLEEQRKEVLNLMETYVVEQENFCCEVEMKAVRGTNLPSADFNGLSDPYVVLGYKAQRKSTRVINCTLNPVWNESLFIRVTSFEPVINITCYDHDFDSSDDLLGTARFNLYDHLEILDGQPHEYVIKLDNKEKHGTVTFEVTCHYPYSSYFDFVKKFDFAKALSDPEKKPIDIPYMDYYNELFAATGELMSTNEEPVWYLREFSSRFCVSEGYCALLKLQTLMLYGIPFSNTIRNYAYSLARFNLPPNKAEIHAFTGCLKNFLSQVKERYIYDLFYNAKTKTEIRLLPQNFHTLVDLAYEVEGLLKVQTQSAGSSKDTKDRSDVMDVIEEGFERGVKKLTGRMGKDIEWAKVSEATKYKDIINTEYNSVMQTIVACIENVPEDLRERLQAAASNALDYSISQHIKKYMETVSKVLLRCDNDMMISLKDNVDEIIVELSELRRQFFEGNKLIIKDTPFNELSGLWLRVVTTYLDGWVKEVAEDDAAKMLKTTKLDRICSVSYEKIHSMMDKMMTHLEGAAITDNKIWLQIGEIFMTTVKDYVISEKEHAKSCLENLGSKEARILKLLCLHLSNMIPATEFIAELNKRITEGMENMNSMKEKKDAYYDSIKKSLADSFEELTKECNTALDEIIKRPAKDCTHEILNIFIKDPRESFKDVCDTYNAVFETFKRFSSEALTKRIKLVFANMFIDIFVCNIRPEMLLTVDAEYLHSILMCSIENYKLVMWQRSTPEGVLGEREANSFRRNIELVPVYTGFFRDVMEFFGQDIDPAVLQANPNYANVLQYANLFEANTETLISLHMKRTADPPEHFSREETSLYGNVNTESILTLIKCFDINGSRWACAYLDEMNGSELSKNLRESFNLPPRIGKPTSIYLTTKSLCYVPALFSSPQSVDLKKIKEITTYKATMGTKVILKVATSKCDETYTFYSSSYFNDYIREQVVKQALEIGNPYLKLEEDEDEKGEGEDK